MTVTRKGILRYYDRKFKALAKERKSLNQRLKTELKEFNRRQLIESGDIKTYYYVSTRKTSLRFVDLEEDCIIKVIPYYLFGHPTMLSHSEFLFKTKEDRETFRIKYKIDTCGMGEVYEDELVGK